MSHPARTLVFFPEERGIAHVTRSLAVAERLRDRGHRVLFALSPAKAAFLARSRVEVVPIDPFVRDDDVDSIEDLKRPAHLVRLVRQEQEILDAYRPDGVVVDLRISALVAARSRSVPTFMITGTADLPCPFYLPNPGLPPPLPGLVLPRIRTRIARIQQEFVDALSQAAVAVGSSFVLDDLRRKVRYIVPEVSDYLPVMDDALEVHYTGPILWDGFDHASPAWLQDITPDGRTVYVTFGGTGYDGRKLVSLSTSLVRKGLRVVVSCSNSCDVDDFPPMAGLHVERYLPGLETCRRVDAVICHGGYGTMIQAVLGGRPIVAAPFNPEQLLHALRFQELGLATCVARWDVGAMARFRIRELMELGRAVSVDAILRAVGKVMRDPGRQAQARASFAQRIRRTTGSEAAADAIETGLEARAPAP